ncbi:DUF4277 domain-containing protein, partial [Hyella patelloides]|uniref:DUF4277 domain-containing protein n=1 Tax=Hyella patelloides TaxID=1982969 RepID=UPI001643BCC5
MTPSTAEIKVKDLDHCGIIAGIIDEIGLVTQIAQIVSKHGLVLTNFVVNHFE